MAALSISNHNDEIEFESEGKISPIDGGLGYLFYLHLDVFVYDAWRRRRGRTQMWDNARESRLGTMPRKTGETIDNR
jgi:hypothetical protein